MEQLDGARSDAGLDLLTQQPVRHRVVMALDVDVIIERHATDPPFGIDERFGGQFRQRRLIELLEQLTATDPELAHRPGIEILDQRRDRRFRSAASFQLSSRWHLSGWESRLFAVAGTAQRIGLQCHQLLCCEANHLAQQASIGGLLQKVLKGNLVIGHRGVLGSELQSQPNSTQGIAVTTAVDK
jgi:hypothetical protein